ncbi:MAG: PDZ domain-containing protein [Planctomycetota bacterium]
MRYGPQDPGAGDNAAFFRRGIPAVLFHTGRTPQYHTPDDDWKLIEKESLEAVARTTLLTLKELASGPRLAFRHLEFPPRRPPMLGIEAERSRGAGTGIRVAYVMSGSAAERAGLTPGDTILSLDGRPTPVMGSLVALLRKRRAGEEAVLEVERDGKILRLTARLASVR